jgi:hypothetical protein
MYFTYLGQLIINTQYLNQYGPMRLAISGAEAGMHDGSSCYGCPIGYSNHRLLNFEAPDTNGFIPWACYNGVIRQNNNTTQNAQPKGCPNDSEFSINL